MTDKTTNMAFSQQQRAQISNACERVQNAININNSTLAELNENLVRKADEIAIKWKAYGLPYNAIRDAVLEMAMWQKEQIMKDAINGIIDCDDDNEWSEEDEDTFNDIIMCLDGNFKSDKSMINWLKSLKERMKG